MDQATLGNVLTVVNIIGGGVFAMLYRAHSVVSSKADQTEKDLAEYKLYVAENYLTNKAMDSIIAKLDRIEDKLDKKQDKAT